MNVAAHQEKEKNEKTQATDPQKLKKLSTVVFSFFVNGSDRCGSGSG